MNISDALTEKMLMVANKISNQKHMYAIKTAFTTLMPVIITGAFCTLVVNVVCSTTTDGISLAKVGGFAWLEMFTDLFTAANYATLNFFTVAAVVLIGLELGLKNGIKGFMPGVVSLCCFVACLSTNIVATVGEETVTVAGLAKDYTAARGLFLGMIVALVSVELFTVLRKSELLKIHMPDSVPPNVTNSFNNLFPFMLTVIICAAINFTAVQVIGLSLYDIIYAFVQEPLQAVVQGLPGVMLLMFVAQIFWCVGIHGNQIIKPIRDPLLNAAILANTEIVSQPNYNPADLNIVSMSFWDTYGNIGGSGCVIGLLIACLLFSKREDYKQVAKINCSKCIQYLRNITLWVTNYVKPIINDSIYYYSINNYGIWLYDDSYWFCRYFNLCVPLDNSTIIKCLDCFRRKYWYSNNSIIMYCHYNCCICTICNDC